MYVSFIKSFREGVFYVKFTVWFIGNNLLPVLISKFTIYYLFWERQQKVRILLIMLEQGEKLTS